MACRQTSPFVKTAARLVQSSLHLVNDANKELQHMLDYHFTQTLASEDVSEVLQDDFAQVPAQTLPAPEDFTKLAWSTIGRVRVASHSGGS
jgi:hypothetical protein